MSKQIFVTLFTLVLILNYSPQAFSVESEVSAPLLEMETPRSYSASTKTMLNGQYVGGGVVSLFVGYGIGHAIQGRYMERGWIFTASELGVLAVFMSTLIYSLKDVISDDYQPNDNIEYVTYIMDHAAKPLPLISLLAFVGVRIWEVVDVWNLPSDYKIVKESPFQLSPLYVYNRNNLDLGLSLKYRF